MKKILLILAIALTGCTAEETQTQEVCECQILTEHYHFGAFVYRELSEESVPCFEPYNIQVAQSMVEKKQCWDGSTDWE